MSESRFPFSFVVVLFFLVWPTTSPAQDRLWTILKDDWSTSWDDAKKNCSDAEATKRWSDIEGCAITIYGLKPPGPEVGSIAPGSSIALGAGLKYTFMHPSDKPGRVGAESDLH